MRWVTVPVFRHVWAIVFGQPQGLPLLYVAVAAESVVVLFCYEIGGVVGVETVATAAADFAVEEAYSFAVDGRIIELASPAGDDGGVAHADGVV